MSTITTKATVRPVEKIFLAKQQSEGVGARVRRSIGSAHVRHLDPFLLLDEFSVRKPAGFPMHPHRGQQTVTYGLTGSIKHADNKGHAGTVEAGGLQYMTAGRGIVHSEMPGPDNDNSGLQLWISLAAKDKLCDPQYQERAPEDVPTTTSPCGKVSVKVIAGTCYGTTSDVYTVTPVSFWDVTAAPDSVFEENIPKHYNAFLYVLAGKVAIDGKPGEHGTCAILGNGDKVVVKNTGTQDARFVVISGRPHNEPIVQHGPFVMNTREEIQQAIRDYNAGLF